MVGKLEVVPQNKKSYRKSINSYHKIKNCFNFLNYNSQGFNKKIRQKKLLKTPKKLVIFASNYYTYIKFYNESQEMVHFRGFLV